LEREALQSFARESRLKGIGRLRPRVEERNSSENSRALARYYLCRMEQRVESEERTERVE